MPHDHVDEAVRTHAALGNATRAQLLRLLQEGSRDAASLARETDLHRNTVREHLEVLVSAGLVSRAPRVTGRPGRPTVHYRLADAPPPTSAPAQPAEHLLLSALAGALSGAQDAPERVAAAAAPLGVRLLGGDPPPSLEVALPRLVETLAELGFEPEVRPQDSGPSTVALHRCPFGDLTARHGAVVCAAHLGLLRGALGAADPDTAVDLLPSADPSATPCLVTLGP
jgi:predicted ArsR family transcriptional regulator